MKSKIAYAQQDAPGSNRLAVALNRAIEVLTDGNLHPSHARRLNELRNRLLAGKLQIAVLGQFKRGKSTFINALLGAPLLPTGVVPLTAIPVFISYGAHGSVEIRFSDGRPTEQTVSDDIERLRRGLFEFVSEEANSANHRNVARVDVAYPSPLLAAGTVLIDTPGIGSTLRHNTEVAFGVLPECDAALFVTSDDPPLTEAERDYLRRLQGLGPKLILVFNKIDHLLPEEQEEVAHHIRKVLKTERLCLPDTPFYQISSRDGLKAKQDGDAIALRRSGLGEIEHFLSVVLATGKAGMLSEAIARKAIGTIEEALSETGLRSRTLSLPVDDLAAKAEFFQKALAEIAREKRVVRDLLEGDRRRHKEDVERRISRLREDATRHLQAAVDEALDRAIRPEKSGLTRLVGTATERIFETARQQITPELAHAVDGTLAAHARCVRDLIENVRRIAANLFDVPMHQSAEMESFALGEDPYWTTAATRLSVIPDARSLLDHIGPQVWRLRRLRKRLFREAQELILQNAENLRWSMLRGIDETFRAAAAHFDDRLQNAVAATEGVIAEARTRRIGGEAAVAPELRRLEKLSEALDELRAEISAAQSIRTEARSVG